MADVALRAVLAVLTAYHLGIGAVSAFSPRTAGRLGATLYGLQIAESAAVRYATRMLGLYALSIGSLLALATWRPAEHRAVIAVVAGLQLARAITRLALRRELFDAFAVPAQRNAVNVAVLVGEAAVLAFWLIVSGR